MDEQDTNGPDAGPDDAPIAWKRPPIDGANAFQLDADENLLAPERIDDLLEQSIFSETGFDAVSDVASAGDGRTHRRTRNRAAVIESLLGLMREGNVEPSVAQIADRAGVSHRSVFRYFDDLSDLVRAAIDREVHEALPLAVIENVGQGTLDRRVDSFIDSRLKIFGSTYQVGRVARFRARTIPAIDEGLKSIMTLVRVQFRNHFHAELSALNPSDAEFIVDAALVLMSFESYDMQLRLLDHSPERIRQMWTHALLTLLAN